MIGKIKKRLREELQKIREATNINSKKNDDIYALSILSSLLVNKPYLPINGGALRPFCMAYLLNEILIGKRESIIEFGSGISTVLIGRLIKENNLNIEFFSVEHNEDWAKSLSTILEKEGLLDSVNIIYVPLSQQKTELGICYSYDFNIIKNEIKNKTFDLVVIDGPPANTSKTKYSRYPVLNTIQNFLNDDFCVLLDDCDRSGEKEIIKKHLGVNPELLYKLESETLGVIRDKYHFNPVPLYYSTKK